MKEFVTKTIGTIGATLGAGVFALENALKIDVIGGTGETGVAVLGVAALIGAGMLALDYVEYVTNEL